MVNIAEAIVVLYPTAIALIDFIIFDDGKGPIITFWNTEKYGPEPTPQMLAAVTPDQVTTYYLKVSQIDAAKLINDSAGIGVAIRAMCIAGNIPLPAVIAALPQAAPPPK